MTTLDADKYRVNEADVFNFTKGKTHEERMQFLGMLAIATNVHIIIVATYVGEIYGFSQDLVDFINRMKLFYNVDKVLNVRVKD